MLMMIVGGSGGIGQQLSPLFSDKYMVTSYDSKQLDITNLELVTEACEALRPDIVLNLAGVNHDSFLHKWNTSNIANANHMINVNVNGALHLMSACLPHMRKQKFGRIIMLSSVLANRSVIGTGVYSATKAFVDSLVKTASTENISHNITCNSIRLGYFDAGMAHRIPTEIADVIKNNIPLKRWGSMEELRNTVDYLISTEYITGQNIEISGGLP